jgi:hypothetical protein
VTITTAVLWALWLAPSVPATVSPQTPSPSLWVDTFGVQKADLRPAGRNPYFILEPGYQLVLEGPGAERLVVTVLDETVTVDGVETRVVEERETKNGQLVEVSRNFFAISSRNDVYYFGEDVDVYKNGKIVNHEGAWRSGVSGARFGLMMPAAPRVGAKYYQEVAPKLAMDRAEIVALDVSMATPAGAFTRVLKIEETTPLERGAREFKYYAEGVGLIQDGSLKLVKHGARVER